MDGYAPSWEDPERIAVSVLMGGEEDGGWDLYPERDAILIGTQDMLLSRALNRGYGMSRYRWPMHFGLLNNDCLWVADEVQLLGAGLATTTQMQAFRRLLGTHHPVRTIWMSATMAPEWLRTVDVDLAQDSEGSLVLSEEDGKEAEVAKRLRATKRLGQAAARLDQPKELAQEIVAAHRPGSRTLVVVNTVKRAMALHEALSRAKPAAEVVLVHSRFRAPDRKRVVESLLAEPGPAGTIVVSTQVVEAGVDLSSATLFTELAPWASLVQRFGRCNRAGEYGDAAVQWIDLPGQAPTESPERYEKRLTAEAKPYELQALHDARAVLERCADVGPASLPDTMLDFAHGQIVRRRDLVELFDTTPDLAGSDVDVSRFIRETDDTDVQVFWRDVPRGGGPSHDEPLPRRDELCAAPISDLRELVRKKARMWSWDSLEESWRPVTQQAPVHPGLTIMLDAADGRYTENEGWKPSSRRPVPVLIADAPAIDSRYGRDPTSVRTRTTLVEHTDRVVAEVERLVEACRIEPPWREALLEAARWHDVGKAHPVFQRTMYGHPPKDGEVILGKTDRRDFRYYRDVAGKETPVPFRHELVSGLLALQHGKANLVAYLAAVHHGKVRLSIRSLPREPRPPEADRRFARGVWDGDLVPDVELGGGIAVPATTIDLSYMELGEANGRGPSWLARTLALRDDPGLGPFRLGFLEMIMKAADERASGGAS
ncbi:MAG: CRISPR-associated helicase Cas3' [Gaiellales bacterium]